MKPKAVIEKIQLNKGDPSALVQYLVGNTIEDIELALIHATIDRCAGNKTMAASILGVHPRTLNNKLKKSDESE